MCIFQPAIADRQSQRCEQKLAATQKSILAVGEAKNPFLLDPAGLEPTTVAEALCADSDTNLMSCVGLKSDVEVCYATPTPRDRLKFTLTVTA